MQKFIVTLSCRDGLGIVAAVSQIFAEAGLNIDESQQFSDADSGMFFMRVGLSTQNELDRPALDKKFAPVAKIPDELEDCRRRAQAARADYGVQV